MFFCVASIPSFVFFCNFHMCCKCSKFRFLYSLQPHIHLSFQFVPDVPYFPSPLSFFSTSGFPPFSFFSCSSTASFCFLCFLLSFFNFHEFSPFLYYSLPSPLFPQFILSPLFFFLSYYCLLSPSFPFFLLLPLLLFLLYLISFFFSLFSTLHIAVITLHFLP